jgi:hypothetical protein
VTARKTNPAPEVGPAELPGQTELAGHIKEPADPFDLDALRDVDLEDITIERVLLSVAVRRPGRNEFFRVHPSPDYTFPAKIIEYTNGLDRETYWVERSLWPHLLEDIRVVRLLTCVSRRGVPFLWPAKLPTDDGAGKRWALSGLEVAERAKTSWVKLVGNKDAGAYEAFVAKGDLGEPEWPDKSFRELIEIAFKENVILTLDHPVLKELDGRA